MNLTDRELRIVELTKALVGRRVEKLPGHQAGFNWGFLWGYVEIRRAQKNGKVREFSVKKCFGNFCPASWADAMAAASTVEGVGGLYYNMD